MPHRGLRNFVTKLPCPCQHLGVGKKPLCLREQVGERVLAEDFQSAITVAHPCSEERPNQDVIAPREEPTLPGIVTLGSVTHCQGSTLAQRQQHNEVGEMKLAIGV